MALVSLVSTVSIPASLTHLTGATCICLVKAPLVMTLLVRNESDVLRENLLYHRDQGVGAFVITTNLSDEPTREIVREFSQHHPVTLIDEPRDDYEQSIWVTRMARLAVRTYRCRWIINNDADEFWHAEAGTLAEFFARQPPWVNRIIAPRRDFVCCEQDEPSRPFWESMIYRKVSSVNGLGTPLPPKMAHRASRWVTVAAGNHSAELPWWGRISYSGLLIDHFPLRSRSQYLQKIRVGGEAMQRNRTQPMAICEVWRRQLDELRQTGRIAYLDKNVFGQEKLAEQLAAGELVQDTDLRDRLRLLTA